MLVECFLAHRTSWVRCPALNKWVGAWWCKIPGLERQRKEDQSFRVTSTAQLVLTTPRDRKLWGSVVAFMSQITSCVHFTTTKQLEKSVSFQRKPFLFLMPAITFDSVSFDSDILGRKKTSLTLSIWSCPFTVLYLFSVFTGMCLTASLILNGMFGTQIRQLGNSCCS